MSPWCFGVTRIGVSNKKAMLEELDQLGINGAPRPLSPKALSTSSAGRSTVHLSCAGDQVAAKVC